MEIRSRVQDILRRMEQAARRAGRDPETVTQVAVSKGVSPEFIQEAQRAGLRIFGESRVQEAVPKLEALSGMEIRWHFIGHLQKNKVKYLTGRFDLIHSVDSIPLAEEIGRRAIAVGGRQKILLQVNVAGESQKGGVSTEKVRATVRDLSVLPGISLEGLMTIPPFMEDPEAVRPYFRLMKKLVQEIGDPLHDISMGMSHDFEAAIEEGATLVRIGTAIFGERS
ncbi:MAG: YggS family pyridoxal phosphate-dependent enzyme [Nitrospirae bacterium]|nr:YggS family pyridoxal phosphate-dependent enzyme [Nitrospirota bacterium]